MLDDIVYNSPDNSKYNKEILMFLLDRKNTISYIIIDNIFWLGSNYGFF